MKPQGFPRSSRLLRRPEFLNIYAQGRRASGQWVVVYALAQAPSTPPSPASDPEGPSPWRVGITATRKLGNAVARNRARRQVREFMRQHRSCWPSGIDFVVNLKPAAASACSAELCRDLTYAFRKLGYDATLNPSCVAPAQLNPTTSIIGEPHV